MKNPDPPASIPAPTPEDKPFPVGGELTVYEASMVYAGRHPYPKMFGPYDESRKREHCLTLLKLGLAERLRRRQRVQRSWDVFRQLKEKIKQGQIQPIKPAYDLNGEIDPIRSVIRTSDLVPLATDRGEQPRYLRHLLKASPEPAAADLSDLSGEEYKAFSYIVKHLTDVPDATREDIWDCCRVRFKVSKRVVFKDLLPRARRQLAAAAAPLLLQAQTPNEKLPHLGSGAGASAKHRENPTS